MRERRSRGRQDSKQALRNFRIQQFSKTRVIHHALKVVVDARLQPVSRIQLDGPGQIFEAFLRLAGHGFKHGNPVKGIVGVGVAGKDAVGDCSRAYFVVAGILLGDGIIIVLFRRCKVEARPFKLALAGNDVHLAAFPDLGRGHGVQLLKSGQGLLVLSLLHQLHSRLIVLEGGEILPVVEWPSEFAAAASGIFLRLGAADQASCIMVCTECVCSNAWLNRMDSGEKAPRGNNAAQALFIRITP